MVKKLICLIWGHKVWGKAYTGQTMNVEHPLGNTSDIVLYKRYYNNICPRCGKELRKSNEQ